MRDIIETKEKEKREIMRDIIETKEDDKRNIIETKEKEKRDLNLQINDLKHKLSERTESLLRAERKCDIRGTMEFIHAQVVKILLFFCMLILLHF